MRVCAYCEASLEGRHPSARACSHGCRSALWEKRAAGNCRDCGVKLATRRSVRCTDCDRVRRNAQREARLAEIERMFKDGLPLADIAAAVGRPRRSVSIGPELDDLRKAGRIGYRYKACEARLAA